MQGIFKISLIYLEKLGKNTVGADETVYNFRRSVNQVDTNVKRGDIYFADLSPVVGSEQGGVRPVLIVQNNVGNKHSPTVIAAAITSQINKARLPTHIELSARSFGLSKDSVVLLEQIRTIDKKRLLERMGKLDDGVMNCVDEALAVSFGLGSEESVSGVNG
jgi:mRNA interferase MazF